MNATFTVARWLAIAIALLGAVDPAITTMRRSKPEVAIVSADRADSSLARRAEEKLEGKYALVRGAYPNAAATVVVGSALPQRVPNGVVFAVRETAPAAIHTFSVPDVSTTEARVPVVISGRAKFPARVEIDANGIVVDHAEIQRGDGDRFRQTLTITPAVAGALPLRARVIGGRDTAVADAVTNVVDDPAPVLFFDRRPSWMSTFVRRALERDRRFAVASRVNTSRGISTDAGQPPSSLADPTVLELYDVIVVGAPELLTASDATGLETFLRRRGGVVVLLFDEKPTDVPATRLAGVPTWSGATSQTVIPSDAVIPSETRDLLFTESAWPVQLPPETIIRATAAKHPLVWSTMVGQGEVIVSGALDAWKFRDPATSKFDEFWQATISRAAREASKAIEIQAPSIATPNELIRVHLTVRDTAAAVSAIIGGQGHADPVQLWPIAAGEYEARVRVPKTDGRNSIEVVSAGMRAIRPLLVAGNSHLAMPDDSAAIATLASTSGGSVVSLDDLESAVGRAVSTESRMERWFPMRSGWWILAFVGLLGAEWFARRRRGLA